MVRKRNKQHACLNCDFEFSSKSEHTNYCPNCGQENHNPRHPLIYYGYELLESFLHFDTKFFYTLKVLLFHPGKLTIDYINNIRGRYMPPFRMFIFISIFALGVVGIFENFLFESGAFGDNSGDQKKGKLTIGEMFDNSSDTLKDKILVAPFSWIMNNPEVTHKQLRKLKSSPSDSIGSWLTENGYSNNVLTRFYAQNKKLRISRQMTDAEVVPMVVNIFKILFLLMIPIFAFVCFVFFYRKNLLYYDTLLYSVHFACFFLILYSVLMLLIMGSAKLEINAFQVIGLLCFCILVVYLAMSLKRVFSFSWFSTLIRMVLSFLICFSLFQIIHYVISSNSGR